MHVFPYACSALLGFTRSDGYACVQSAFLPMVEETEIQGGKDLPQFTASLTPPPVLLPQHRARCQTLSSAHLEENSWEPQDHTINARVTLVSSQPFQKLRGSHESGKCGRHKILQKEEEIFQGHRLTHRRLLFRARHLGLFPGRKKGERFFFFICSLFSIRQVNVSFPACPPGKWMS